MPELKDVMERLITFRDERDWAQFHNSKDLAIAISIEAAELNEAFLWKQSEAVDTAKVKEELADVLSFAFLLAHKHGWDIPQLVLDKIEQNEAKYPADKARGTAKKYNEL